MAENCQLKVMTEQLKQLKVMVKQLKQLAKSKGYMVEMLNFCHFKMKQYNYKH